MKFIYFFREAFEILIISWLKNRVIVLKDRGIELIDQIHCLSL